MVKGQELFLKKIPATVQQWFKSSSLQLNQDQFQSLWQQWISQGIADEKSLAVRLAWLYQNRFFLDKPIKKIGHEEINWALHQPKESLFLFLETAIHIKRVQLEEIYNELRKSNELFEMEDFSINRILQEMKWWLYDLNLPKYYFERVPSKLIARQILLTRAQEMQRKTEQHRPIKIRDDFESISVYWVARERALEVEEELEKEFSDETESYNISSYSIVSTHGHAFKLYLIERSPVIAYSNNFSKSAPVFLSRYAPKDIQERYKELFYRVLEERNFQLEVSEKKETQEFRTMIAFPRLSMRRFFSNVLRTIELENIEITRKYTSTMHAEETIIITSIYTKKRLPPNFIFQLNRLSLFSNTLLSNLVEEKTLKPSQVLFLDAASAYLHQFLQRKDNQLAIIAENFSEEQTIQALVRGVQRKINADEFLESYIQKCFYENVELSLLAYRFFCKKQDPTTIEKQSISSLKATMLERIDNNCKTENERFVFKGLIEFVEAIVRCNFFKTPLSALSFRLKQGFLKNQGLPREPFAVFFIYARDFIGFHVRFSDIARGGIRIIPFYSEDQRRKNIDSAFEEAYNLAHTQHKKNKDIPEGGSKGVVVLTQKADDTQKELAFKRYIDALLDLICSETEKQIKHAENEALFLGPDEGSAGWMDWAAKWSKIRLYPYWQAFTTGKSAAMGGISHIDFGMTTQGVHQYVLELLKTAGIKENSITKVQTGGPDGDLGSNEILLSKDKTLCIIDGSGVLFDPNGLDRQALRSLAKKRQACAFFPTDRLSNQGFLVKTTDNNVVLPQGELVHNGVQFRNHFHLHPLFSADLFVPCGGRPRSIDLTNWKTFLRDDGTCKVKWIVEGANLFITDEARNKLQEHGVLLFKDSSTNKGGVTSSSLEVLAALALSDEQFNQQMSVTGKEVSTFRNKYIREVIQIIRSNAKREYQNTLKYSGKQFNTHYADLISRRILEIEQEIIQSQLLTETKLVRKVMENHLPASLLEMRKIEDILKQLPDNYTKAYVSKVLARELVYKAGPWPKYEEYRLLLESLRS